MYSFVIVSLGYVFITNIPVGATDIQIIERRKTENILGKSFLGWSVKIQVGKEKRERRWNISFIIF